METIKFTVTRNDVEVIVEVKSSNTINALYIINKFFEEPKTKVTIKNIKSNET